MAADVSLEVRVLTLAGAVDRQARMRGVLHAAKGLDGVPWRFVHAVGHGEAGLLYDDATALRAKGRTLSRAEVSCFASHVAILRDWLVAGSSDVLLVLEDDVYLDPWFDVRDAARLVAAAGLDYLRFYERAITPSRQLVYSRRTQVVRFTWSPGGMQAFMLTRTGAGRVIAAVEAAGRRIMQPIDDFMDRYWEVGNPLYSLHPSPVLELNMPTTIHTADQERAQREAQAALEARPPAGAIERASRRAEALRDRLARRLVERRLQREEPAVAARVLAFLEAPGFRDLRVAA